MAVYVSEYAAELRHLGASEFGVRYPSPVLVVKGVGGNLKDSSGHGGTMITDNLDELRQATMLIGRVFLLRKGRAAAPGPITVGRTAVNDVTIPEYSISQRHCLIRLEGGAPRSRTRDPPMAPTWPGNGCRDRDHNR